MSYRRDHLAVALGAVVHPAAALAVAAALDFSPTPVVLAFGVAGAVLVGASVAAARVRWGLAAPALAVAALFGLTAYGSWTVLGGPAPTPTPVGPTAFGWYLLGWPVALGVAALAGLLEVGLDRLLARRPADGHDRTT